MARRACAPFRALASDIYRIAKRSGNLADRTVYWRTYCALPRSVDGRYRYLK
ncbi:MAG TPA: hypothetical protein PKM48_03330 [Parvularculaceae bacterium]|nr:hypothetical protein [Parvularculaceae bacterium]